jgi:predicted bacteriocin transport accessory protein
MNKIFGIIAFFISIICVLACAINVFISIDTYGKNKERIQELEKRVVVLENELSTALGYDITDEEAGDTSGQYDISSFTKIKPTELTTLSQGKKIVVWIGRQGCSYCSLYAPTIKSVTKDLGIKAYYIDLGAMYDASSGEWQLVDEEGYNTIMGLQKANADAEKLMADFGATPMTLVIEDNAVVNGAMGAIGKEDLSKILETEGFKK